MTTRKVIFLLLPTLMVPCLVLKEFNGSVHLTQKLKKSRDVVHNGMGEHAVNLDSEEIGVPLEGDKTVLQSEPQSDSKLAIFYNIYLPPAFPSFPKAKAEETPSTPTS